MPYGIQWLTAVNFRVLCEILDAHWPNAGCLFLPYMACEQALHWEESRELTREQREHASVRGAWSRVPSRLALLTRNGELAMPYNAILMRQ